ncbi:MAG: hypothetical protein ACK55I_00070, partial [bacterium]
RPVISAASAVPGFSAHGTGACRLRRCGQAEAAGRRVASAARPTRGRARPSDRRRRGCRGDCAAA